MPKLLPLVLLLSAALVARPQFSSGKEAAEICDVVNESKAGVQFAVVRQGVQPRTYTLAPKSSTQISTTGDAQLELADGRFRLTPGMKYAFRENAKGQVALVTVGKRPIEAKPKPAKPTAPPVVTPRIIAPTAPLPEVGGLPIGPSNAAGSVEPTAPNVSSATGEVGTPRTAARVATVTVKILVDDEEAARDDIWKKRLGDRLNAASEIIEKTAGVRFHVIEFARWQSDDAIHDFSRTLREFETKVDGDRARLVIGFSSQYEIPKGEVHLGGTRGPLHSHILIREWSRHIAEPERLEVLVHELGHFLGAVHSSDSTSVMRAKLGDRRSRAVNFEIRYDDANAQILRIFGDEMRLRPVRRLADLSDRTKADLLARYDALAKANPKDPAVKRHIELVEQAGGKR